MSLRAKLVLAFLLLAIVPLAALTLYSYYSSTQAFRRVAEAESAEIARNMRQRMAVVTRDLNQRLNRLGSVPFNEVMNQVEGSRRPTARWLYRQVMNEFGEAAGLISALEYHPQDAPDGPPEVSEVAPGEGSGRAPDTPRRRPGVPPASGLPIQPPRPDSMVLYFPEVPVFRRSREEALTRRREAMEEEVLQELEEVETEVIIRQEQERLIIETTRARQVTDELIAQANQVGMAVVHQLSQIAGEKTAAGMSEKLEKTLAGMGEGPKTVVNRAIRNPEIKAFLGRTLNSVVRISGRQVGTIRAQVNTRRVVGRVFSAARRRQGEIPFALDSEGNLFTENEEDRQKLEGLNLQSLTALAEPELAREMGDWLVVSREEPNSGMTFGIARPMASRLQEIQRTAIYNLLFGLGVVGFALVGILPLSGRMTRNLETLSDGARKLTTGDLDARVPVRSKDEFGRLVHTFNRMAVQLKEQKNQLVEQERIRKELEMCRLIQEELLPRHPLRVPFAEVN